MKKQWITAMVLAALFAVGADASATVSAQSVHGQITDSARPGRWYGADVAAQELVVAGVPMGVKFDAIVKSLGTPTKINYLPGNGPLSSLEYGGIKYIAMPREDYVTMIEITNRDATTARGIAVGDSIARVQEVYGQPLMVSSRNWNNEYFEPSWFYGHLYMGSEYIKGIWFANDGKKVTRIIVLDGITNFETKE
ncbi:hypothetical protein [uncultured Veillonella sp.]|uniref:hypothetical protein n=1 Tax=uncultured Veillonella sp. TaxID=159268 RepID=UPI0025FDB0A1|nr:hypothetical protein [uncultured Veillonella sp.]MDY3973913.1 hypothetical protein [Veillonella caviae]